MFNVRKATQVAAYLIWKRGGTMSYLKLMKLMYLAEKDSLLRNEEFLTGSKLVSMPRGPVLSSVYDLFFGGNEYWDQWIYNSGHYNLSVCQKLLNLPSAQFPTFCRSASCRISPTGQSGAQRYFSFLKAPFVSALRSRLSDRL